MHVLADANADVTAWATVAAVVVALLGSMGTGLWKWLRRPRITITFGPEAPLTTIEPSPISPEWHHVRARVENKGHRGARRVRAQITGAWFKADSEPRADGRIWPDLIQLPIPLPWASRSFEGSQGTEYVDLAPHLVDYLDISRKSMRLRMSTYEHRLLGLGAEPTRQSLLDRMMKVGEYRIEVAVFSDDTKPVTSVVSYKQRLSTLQLQEIQRSKRPPKDPAPGLPESLSSVFKGAS